MKQQTHAPGPREISWPVGPDATYPGPLAAPEDGKTGQQTQKTKQGADVRL